jgi:hypothetical protein
MAYDKLEPFGEERADLRSAIVARTIAEIHRDKDKRGEPFRLDEFMPEFGEENRQSPDVVEVDELSPAAQRNWLEMLNAAYGGKDLR